MNIISPEGGGQGKIKRSDSSWAEERANQLELTPTRA